MITELRMKLNNQGIYPTNHLRVQIDAAKIVERWSAEDKEFAHTLLEGLWKESIIETNDYCILTNYVEHVTPQKQIPNPPYQEWWEITF